MSDRSSIEKVNSEMFLLIKNSHINLCEGCSCFGIKKFMDMGMFNIRCYEYDDCHWEDDTFIIHEFGSYGIKPVYYYDYFCHNTPGNLLIRDYLNCPECIFHKGKFSNNAQNKVNLLIGINDPKFILPSCIEVKINDNNNKIFYDIKKYTLYLLILEKIHKKYYYHSEGIISLYIPDTVTICALFFHLKSNLLFINNRDILQRIGEFIGSEYDHSKEFDQLGWSINKDRFPLNSDNIIPDCLDFFCL